MSEQKKKAGPGAIGAGVIGFIIAAIVGVTVVNQRDDEKKAPPATDTSTSAPSVPADPGVPPEPPATDTGQPGEPGGPIVEPAEPSEPEPTRPPVTEPDEMSSRPGRVRIVFPPPEVTPACVTTARRWIEGARKEYGEPVAKGYAYLLDRCDLVQEIQRSGQDPVTWLAEQGYDSPAAVCSKATYKIDRRIRPGDNVALKLWDDGVLRYVYRVSDWTPIEGMMLARVLEQSPAAWLVTSYGRHVLVPIDANRSSTIEREGWNVVAIELHGESFSVEVDPRAEIITPEIELPCWRDRATAARMAWGKRVSMRLDEIPEIPAQ